MKVKELIKLLKKMDQEAYVVSQEYTGCHHTIHDIQTVIEHAENETVTRWDGSTTSNTIESKTGRCKRPVVYIN